MKTDLFTLKQIAYRAGLYRRDNEPVPAHMVNELLDAISNLGPTSVDLTPAQFIEFLCSRDFVIAFSDRDGGNGELCDGITNFKMSKHGKVEIFERLPNRIEVEIAGEKVTISSDNRLEDEDVKDILSNPMAYIDGGE